jgi:MoaA/NifB/PqqE/SkfB family radical SAM enzyme
MSIPRTNELRIETSTICNAACVFCPWPTDDFIRNKKIMSLKDYQFYLDKALEELGDQITETSFSGFGEIFLDKTVIDKIEYACSKDLNVHILTNGSLVTTDQIDAMFNAGIKDIRFSIHTTDPINYTKIMNFGGAKFNFERTKSTIDYAIANKPDNIEVIITADIVEENKDDVEKLIMEFEDRCILEVWYPHNWVYGKKYRDTSETAALTTCGRPASGPIQLQIEGDIIMCCFDFNNKMVLGNFRNQSFKEIFNDSIFKNIYQIHEMGTCGSSDLICNGCDQLLDKSNIIIYNNRDKKEERTKFTSTGLSNIIKRSINNGKR